MTFTKNLVYFRMQEKTTPHTLWITPSQWDLIAQASNIAGVSVSRLIADTLSLNNLADTVERYRREREEETRFLLEAFAKGEE